MSENRKPYLIGLSGGSGCGKTTVIQTLFEELPKGSISLISQDNYYLKKEEQPIDENGVVNFDTPNSFRRKELLEDVNLLAKGNTVSYLEYTFNNKNWEPKKVEIQPAPIVLIEGLFVFHFEELRKLFDYRVFIDTDEEERLKRRIKRDLEERGYPEDEVRYQWKNHVMPAFNDYLHPFIDSCDLIIDNSHHFREDLDVLKAHIHELLKENQR